MPVRRWQSSDRRRHHRHPLAVLRTVLAGSDVEAGGESMAARSVLRRARLPARVFPFILISGRAAVENPPGSVPVRIVGAFKFTAVDA